MTTKEIKVNTIKLDELASFLRHPANSKRFRVMFTKRSTGEIRFMNATTQYEQHLKGGQLAYDANEKKLLPVWDLDKEAFRSIPLDAVLFITIKRKTYAIV